MDSTLSAWREGEDYQKYEKARKNTDSAGYQFEALAADATGNHEEAARNWQKAIDLGNDTAKHNEWYLNYRLAAALLAIGKVDEAMAQIAPMLDTNPRLINPLVLKVKGHLKLNQGDQALAALEQLQWSISKSDPDYPARVEAAELEAQVSVLAGPQ